MLWKVASARWHGWEVRVRWLWFVGLMGCSDSLDDVPKDRVEDDELSASEQSLWTLLRDGIGDPETVLHDVAWREGLPFPTAAGTHLFIQQASEGTWGLAGDFTSWEPLEMDVSGDLWWVEVEIPSPEGQTYKFVELTGKPSSWQADPMARSYGRDDFGEFSYVAPPTDAYRLDRWPDLSGRGLSARHVRVYVPPGVGPWPVLYMHDGQNLFDPAAFWGGWRMQDAVAAVGRDVLVVGVDNTVDRMSEYTHVPDLDTPTLGDAYAALVVEDLRPVIEEAYPTSDLDGVMGSSLGGLVSLHIADRYSDTFDFAGSLSGTLGWGQLAGDEELMEARYAQAGVRTTRLFLDSGGGGGPDGLCQDLDGDGFVEDDPDSEDNYCVTRSFADGMADIGYTWDENLWHWWEPDAPHNELAWAERVDRPLSLFLSL